MHLIVGLNGEILHNTVNLEIRKQVEDVLEIVDDRRVVSKFARQYILEVLSHLLDFLSQSLEGLNLVTNLLGKLTLRSVLDVSEEMFNTNFFGLGCPNSAWNMDKLSHQITIIINFFLSAISFSGDTWGSSFMDFN